MLKSVLTYFTILAITVLPVELISANAETLSMQMSMNQTVLSKTKCLHDMSKGIVEIKSDSLSSCCDEPSNDCQGCNDVPHASSAMVTSVHTMVSTSLLKSPKFSISHLVLNGISQQNLLRPPRNII